MNISSLSRTIFSAASGRLIDFNLAIIRHLVLNLGLDTEIIRLSELKIESGGDRLLIEICRYFDASVYLAPGAAGKYLNAALFEQAGIELRCVESPPSRLSAIVGRFYPQPFNIRSAVQLRPQSARHPAGTVRPGCRIPDAGCRVLYAGFQPLLFQRFGLAYRNLYFPPNKEIKRFMPAL